VVKKKRRFSFRALTSLILFWMFAVLLVSGVVLYIAPAGRIAHWTEWRMLALTKEQWQGLHTLSSLTFLIGGLFHFLKFNRRVIWTYVKRSRVHGSPFRGALAASVLAATLVIVGTLAGVPPFSYVVDLGERATDSWDTSDVRPPAPHAEELPIAQVVERLGLDPATARSILESAGIRPEGPEQLLKDVAHANRTTPAAIYALLSEKAPQAATGSAASPAGGAGLGRMTLGELAAELGLERDEAVELLLGQGVKAGPSETLRRIAERHQMTPMQLRELLEERR